MNFILAFLAAAASAALEFHPDGTFRLVQFTDLHYNYELWDGKTVDDTTLVVNVTKPDLAVLTGDITSGTTFVFQANQERKWKECVAVFQEAGVPWAMTLGNHDPDGPMTQEELLAVDQSLNGSLSQSMAKSEEWGGLVNYYVPIYAPKHVEGDDPVALLWLFDVTLGNCMGTSGDDCVSTDIIRWYRETRELLNAKRVQAGKKNIAALAFTHIPPPEMMTLWNTERCVGLRGENVCCPSNNTGLYDALAEDRSSIGLFFGHDHKNDFCGSFSENPNLLLCYGRKSGYGYYNPDHHGARVIDLTLDLSTLDVTLNTFLVDENAKVVAQEWHEPEEEPVQTKC